LTQNAPALAMRGQLDDVRATLKQTSGGSSDSEAKDWHAKPTGDPSSAAAVITVMPVAKCPNASRIARASASSSGSPSTTACSGVAIGPALKGAPVSRR
jgi:hypothetical protein